MNIDKLEKYLDELSDGTDFAFVVSDVQNEEVERICGKIERFIVEMEW